MGFGERAGLFKHNPSGIFWLLHLPILLEATSQGPRESACLNDGWSIACEPRPPMVQLQKSLRQHYMTDDTIPRRATRNEPSIQVSRIHKQLHLRSCLPFLLQQTMEELQHVLAATVQCKQFNFLNERASRLRLVVSQTMRRRHRKNGIANELVGNTLAWDINTANTIACRSERAIWCGERMLVNAYLVNES